MILVDAKPEERPEERRAGRPARRRPSPWGWLAAGSACAVVAVVWLAYGVRPLEMLRFTAYLAIGLAVPGTLLWRALGGPKGPFVQEVAAGTALGYALEIFAYVPARWIGAPRLVLLWPAAVIGAFLAFPRLRRHWRGRGASGQIPGWCAWSMALMISFIAFWSGPNFFSGHPLRGARAPYIDLPNHLALAAELKHHMPPTTSYVLGEPLSYHWFVYADLAATSWATGIELQTLLYRMSMLPMAAVFVVLIAATARWLSGRWWVGLAALSIAYFTDVPRAVTHGLAFAHTTIWTIWISPSQTLGAMLFAPAVLVLLRLLRSEPAGPGGRTGVAVPGTGRTGVTGVTGLIGAGTRGSWVLLAILLAAVMGAKATYLPMLLAGSCLVIVLGWIIDRRVSRPAVITAGLSLLCIAYAVLVLCGGRSYGLTLRPLSTATRMYERAHGAPAGLTTLLLSVALFLAGCLCVWAGSFGLLRRPVMLLEPPIHLLLGFGITGVASVLLLGHPGMSELYFLKAAAPYMACLAALGLCAALPRRRRGPRAAAGGSRVVVARSRAGELRRWALPVVLVAITFLGLDQVQRLVAMKTPDLGRPYIPVGALAAGRWLRDHSGPDDVVATDLHCRFPRRGKCDNRHFWVSAYTERRILVEGWGYAASSLARISDVNKQSLSRISFWDERRLADNDEVFDRPSEEAVRRLRDVYGVRWLFTRDLAPWKSAWLAAHTRLRYQARGFDIYELPN